MKLLLTCALITLSTVYLGGSPYPPKSITGSSLGDLTYHYNTMGQRLGQDQGQSIKWGLVDKPTKITTPNGTEAIAYGLAGRRYLRVNANNKKIFYVGDCEYQIESDGTTRTLCYIRDGQYSPIAAVKKSGNTVERSYFLQDHLGSNLLTVNDSGAISPMSHGRYDPWGRPWRADGTKREMIEESRAFTGHENIASADMIHMNGRVNDPVIGQFLSPDRQLQNANRMVGLNRYAYVDHSTLNQTDPSGWMKVPKILEERVARIPVEEQPPRIVTTQPNAAESFKLRVETHQAIHGYPYNVNIQAVPGQRHYANQKTAKLSGVLLKDRFRFDRQQFFADADTGQRMTPKGTGTAASSEAIKEALRILGSEERLKYIEIRNVSEKNIVPTLFNAHQLGKTHLSMSEIGHGPSIKAVERAAKLNGLRLDSAVEVFSGNNLRFRIIDRAKPSNIPAWAHSISLSPFMEVPPLPQIRLE